MLRTLLLLSLVAIGCGYKKLSPYLEMSADFDRSHIPIVDRVINDVSRENSLSIFKKSAEDMSALSNGKAFFTSIYYRDNPIISITNVGSSNRIVLIATDYGDLSPKDLNRISLEIVSRLEKLTGEEFKLKSE